jgi:hypothetical protein
MTHHHLVNVATLHVHVLGGVNVPSVNVLVYAKGCSYPCVRRVNVSSVFVHVLEWLMTLTTEKNPFTVYYLLPAGYQYLLTL